jgi:hypothetical protein
VVQFVKVHVDAVMLLRLPGDKGYVFEFVEETLTGSGRRIGGPTVSNLKMEGEVRTKASRNRSS